MNHKHHLIALALTNNIINELVEKLYLQESLEKMDHIEYKELDTSIYKQIYDFFETHTYEEIK